MCDFAFSPHREIIRGIYFLLIKSFYHDFKTDTSFFFAPGGWGRIWWALRLLPFPFRLVRLLYSGWKNKTQKFYTHFFENKKKEKCVMKKCVLPPAHMAPLKAPHIRPPARCAGTAVLGGTSAKVARVSSKFSLKRALCTLSAQ